jgi:hypothetical protein
MKYAMNEILNYIGINIRYVDNKNKNTTRDYDYLVIKMNEFITERPKDIFIKKELVKKGHGNNVYVDKNKIRVYEYNINYYSYNNYKLTNKCKELSEKIDEEYKQNKKPLIISYTKYNEITEILQNKLNKAIIKNTNEKTQNNEINILKSNQTQYKIEALINNDEKDEDFEIIEEEDDYEYNIEEEEII